MERVPPLSLDERDPRQAAYGAVWLLSHESSYMTGQSLVLDGGVHALG